MLAVPLCADTIYQEGAEGQQLLVQRDAIVIQQDSDTIIYKHFDLPDQRVERVRLNQGSLAYSVEISSQADHSRILALWKRFGNTANVTDLQGKTTQVFDAYIDYYPPPGKSFLLQMIPATTSLPLQLEGGGLDLIAFSRIATIDFSDGRIRVVLRNDRTEEGTYLMPATEPAQARFLGITDHYNPESQQAFDFSIPLSQIKEIKFQ